MSSIGQPERVTQDRVIGLFHEKFEYHMSATGPTTTTNLFC